jgi:integrase
MAGSVRERSPGRWQLRVYRGRDPLTGRKRWATKTVAATSEKDAQRQCNVWDAELHAHDGGDAGTFGDLVARWSTIKAPRWSPSVRYQTQWTITRHFGQLAPIPVDRITAQTLDEFYAALRARGGQCTAKPRCDTYPCPHGAPLAASTVARIHVVIRAALEQAVKWGWIRSNPARLADPGEIDEAEITPPDAGDAVRLIAAAEEHDADLAPFLVLAVATGARRGALCAARWSDIDLTVATIRFPRVVVDGPDGIVEQPATRRKRSGALVAIDPYTVATLGAHRDRQATRAKAAGAVLPADAHLFSDDLLGERPWRPDTTSKRFRRVRNGLGLDCRLHDLRHLSATVLVAAGVDVRTVAQRGGWRKASTLIDRYAHAVDPADRAAADILGELLTRRPAGGNVVELG